MARRARCVCGCGQASANNHHVIYQQELRHRKNTAEWRAMRNGVKIAHDPRNLVPMAFDCHMAHHNRSRVLSLVVLPDVAFEFAGLLMGPAAFDYLRRRYRGDDPRLEALLS